MSHPILSGLPMIMLSALSCTTTGDADTRALNFAHLRHLTERIVFFGDTVSIVHVYSNYPDYHWTGAAESGPEGIACVDDAARGAVLYLRHFEVAGDTTSLMEARLLLRFVLHMQTADGEFYNFIRADHCINTEGRTSEKSFGWWAARGIWAMGTGCRVLGHADSTLARDLKQGVERSLPHVAKLLESYGQEKTVKGYRVPEWLLYGSGADVVSELLLGLLDYYSVSPSGPLLTMIRELADGITIMQDGDISRYPFGLHRSWETLWHLWGNGQTQALATAGRMLGLDTMIVSAEREARGFYPRLLMEGFMKECDVSDPASRKVYDQIAYGIRPMAVGLIRLYEATQREEYLVLAGLAASWLFGDNVPGARMYDPVTGRCFDGITDSATINRNSGAESTIEALSTLLEVERYPRSVKYLHYRRMQARVSPDSLIGVFRGNDGGEVTLFIDVARNSLQVLEGEQSIRFHQGLH